MNEERETRKRRLCTTLVDFGVCCVYSMLFFCRARLCSFGEMQEVLRKVKTVGVATGDCSIVLSCRNGRERSRDFLVVLPCRPALRCFYLLLPQLCQGGGDMGWVD